MISGVHRVRVRLGMPLLPCASAEQLLGVITCRRGDGREIALDRLPLAEALSGAETVRAEEIELSVPDGRRVTTLTLRVIEL